MLSSVYAWPEVRRGGERYLHELGAALTRAGHDVLILTTAPRADRDHVQGVPVRRVRRRRWRPARHGALADQVAFGWQCLPRALLTGADVWHATSTGDAAAAVAAARWRRGLTTVFTDHGFPAAASRGARTDARYHRRVVAGVDHYVCVSPAAGNVLHRDYGRAADVVPPGVRIADYAPARREARPTLLFVGDVAEERKHAAEFLAAAAVVGARIPDLQVWLFGPGDAAGVVASAPPAARAAVTEARLADPAELPGRYARAWATVLPSEAEAFGMVVVESLAAGTPVVVLAGSGGPEGIVDAATGAVASGLGPDALADACVAALDLACAPATPAACRDRAAAYDWDAAVVPALERLYR